MSGLSLGASGVQGFLFFQRYKKDCNFIFMAKTKHDTVKKAAPKKRATTYEKPVTFNGTFEDMILISTTGAGVKKKIENQNKK